MGHAVVEGQGIQVEHNAHLLCRLMNEMMFSSLNHCSCSCFKVCFEIGNRLLPSPWVSGFGRTFVLYFPCFEVSLMVLIPHYYIRRI